MKKERVVIPGERRSPRKRKGRDVEGKEEEDGESVEKLTSEFEEGVELDDNTFQKVSGWGWMGGVYILMYIMLYFSAKRC